MNPVVEPGEPGEPGHDRDRERDREAWLVLRAQSGDREAFDELLRSVERPLAGFVRRIVLDPDLAGDVLQETFLRIVRHLRYLRDPRFVRAWAFRVASREGWRALERRSRRRDRERPYEDDGAAEARDVVVLAGAAEAAGAADSRAGVDELLIARESHAETLRRLDRLSPRLRAVIHLHFLEEMTLAEVADVLEIPLGTVKSRLAAGLVRLREAMEREAPGRP